MKNRNKENQNKIKRGSYSSYGDNNTQRSSDRTPGETNKTEESEEFENYKTHIHKIKFLQLFFKFKSQLLKPRRFKQKNIKIENKDLLTIKICYVDENDEFLKLEIMTFEGKIRVDYKIKELTEDESWKFTGRENELLEKGQLFDSLVIIEGEEDDNKKEVEQEYGGFSADNHNSIEDQFKSVEKYGEGSFDS